MHRIIIAFTLACVLFSACCKEDMEDIIKADGNLVWAGMPAADGLGLLLEVGTDQYFVSNEQNAFINFTDTDHGSIEVTARYILTEDYVHLGLGGTPLRQVKIVEIKRR